MRYFIFCFLSLIPLLVIGQVYNPPSQTFTATPGSEIIVGIETFSDVNFVKSPDPNIFSVSLGIKSGSTFPLIVKLIDNDFIGTTSFDVFYEGGEKGKTKQLYTTITIDVVESYVEAIHDYESIVVGESNVSIDALANDLNSGDELSITSLSLIENGQATIDNNKITFTPDDGFMGMAYINYSIENEYGIKDQSTITVCVLSDAAPSPNGVISLSTSQYKPVTILLPVNGLKLSESSEILGKITHLGDDVIEYQPFGSFVGAEEFDMISEDGSITRTVNVHVLRTNQQFGPVRNDKFYTSVNTPVSFNIFDNDVEKTTLVTIPKGLKHLGGGSFEYTPPKDFSGIRTFRYSTSKKGDYYSGRVEIIINNYLPENISQYEFVTRQASPLLLNYSVPIEDYSFEILEHPNNGQLIIFPEYYNYQVGNDSECGWTERGVEILRYQPNGSFVGSDAFKVQYCSSNGDCDDLQIAVDVIEEDADCRCVGSDCVWPGDFDADGKVSIYDILPLGYHFGTEGHIRDETSDVWIGEKSLDWGEAQEGNGKDIKFIDASGDGQINLSDLELMDTNYDKYHNLVAGEVAGTTNIPITLQLSQTEAEVGDLLFIDVMVGSEFIPALDVHGLAYTLPLSPDVVDLSSVIVETVNGNWLSHNSPMISLDKQRGAGLLDIGISRTTGVSVSGFGLIHRVGIIIIEDIDGIREEQEGNRTVTMSLDMATMTDGSGNQYSLKSNTVSFELIRPVTESKSIESIEESKVILYPNPTSNDLNIHVNGNDILQEIAIFNLAGQTMEIIKINNANNHRIDLSAYPEALYISRVTTLKGTSTHKFKVNKE